MAERQTLKAHAERPAGIDRGVDAAALEDLRVDHAGAEHLDPALALAGGAACAVALVALNVHFAARLGEREVMGAEARDRVLAVELAHDLVERALEVRHRNALVDGHALDLVEHGRVRGVDLVLAVHAAGSENADGQLARLHRVDLHGRGLRAQKDRAVLGEIERVAPLAGGMALLDVELREVVLGKFDLAVFENFKAHADEDVLDLVEHLIHRVLHADLFLLAGDGHVHGLGLELELHGLVGELFRLFLDVRFELGAHVVGELPDHGALFGAELAHLLQNGGQLPLFAKVADAQCFEVLRLAGVGDRIERRLADRFQLLFHIISPFQVKICRISKIGGRGKKIAFPPDTLGTKDFLPRYHPDSRPKARAHCP